MVMERTREAFDVSLRLIIELPSLASCIVHRSSTQRLATILVSILHAMQISLNATLTQQIHISSSPSSTSTARARPLPTNSNGARTAHAPPTYMAGSVVQIH